MTVGSDAGADVFAPGDSRRIRTSAPGFSLRRRECGLPAEPAAAAVEVPARVGFCVRDLSAMAPGKPGGGGLGMALDLCSRTVVYAAPRPAAPRAGRLVARGARAPVVEHQMHVFRRCLEAVGWPASFSAVVVHSDAFPAHCGLGSTSGAALGALHGLNACLGRPFVDDEIRLMLAWNYVEEADGEGGRGVRFGWESTMTATGAGGGGCFVIDPVSLQVVARNVGAFAGLPVLLFAPQPSLSADADAAPDETGVLTEGGGADRRAAEAARKAELFDGCLVPQLRSGGACDLREMGRAVHELQTLGGKRVEVERQPRGRAIFGLIEAVRADPAVAIVGMSSVGPSVAAVCRPGADDAAWRARLEAAAAARGLGLAYATSVNAGGMRAAPLALPRLAAVLGRPYAGKTTLCERAARASERVLHFAAGAVLREFVASGAADEAKEIADVMAKGEVEDRGGLTTAVLLGSLLARVAAAGGRLQWTLLDGFPRTPAQLDELADGFGLALDCALIVSASDDERRARAAARGARGVAEPGPEARDRRDRTEAAAAAAAVRGARVLHVDNGGRDEREPLTALLGLQPDLGLQA